MTTKFNVTELKKHLREKNEKELINEIAELYKRFVDVENYYTSMLSPQDSIEVLKTYKKKITNEFFPKKGEGKARLDVSRKVIDDYTKIAPSSLHIIDLLLYLVEEGSDYVSECGNDTEALYNFLEDTFETALEMIDTEDSIEGFNERCCEIIANAVDAWGFQDGLDIRYQHYSSSRNV